jgi:hypothetical protein
MAQPPDPIDAILTDLQRDLGHCHTMLRICQQLRRNSAHLLQLLTSMLAELAEQIEAALPRLPAEEDHHDA